MQAEIVSLKANSMALNRRAERIRSLMVDMTHNLLTIGRELVEARRAFPTGPNGEPMGWSKWVKKEFNFSKSWAGRLMAVTRKFGEVPKGHLIPIKVLIYLARRETPEAGRKEVMRRIAQGEHIGEGKAKKIVQKHLPSPKKANEIAKQTGKPTVASDGYVYLGADAKDVKQSAERRTVVYAVRDAVSCLATIDLTATEFLEYAMPHQLWKAKEEHEIKDALKWLQALSKAWGER